MKQKLSPTATKAAVSSETKKKALPTKALPKAVVKAGSAKRVIEKAPAAGTTGKKESAGTVAEKKLKATRGAASTAAATTPKSSEKKVDGKKMEAKWGARVIKAGGFTSIPNLLIDYQQKLGIDSVDLNILLILMKHWWDADRFPYPSKEAMANLTGRDKSTIQKHLARMEEKNILARDYQYDGKGGQTNTRYDLTCLIAKLEKIAKQEMQLREERKEIDDRKKRGR